MSTSTSISASHSTGTGRGRHPAGLPSTLAAPPPAQLTPSAPPRGSALGLTVVIPENDLWPEGASPTPPGKLEARAVQRRISQLGSSGEGAPRWWIPRSFLTALGGAPWATSLCRARTSGSGGGGGGRSGITGGGEGLPVVTPGSQGSLPDSVVLSDGSAITITTSTTPSSPGSSDGSREEAACGSSLRDHEGEDASGPQEVMFVAAHVLHFLATLILATALLSGTSLVPHLCGSLQGMCSDHAALFSVLVGVHVAGGCWAVCAAAWELGCWLVDVDPAWWEGGGRLTEPLWPNTSKQTQGDPPLVLTKGYDSCRAGGEEGATSGGRLLLMAMAARLAGGEKGKVGVKDVEVASPPSYLTTGSATMPVTPVPASTASSHVLSFCCTSLRHVFVAPHSLPLLVWGLGAWQVGLCSMGWEAVVVALYGAWGAWSMVSAVVQALPE